MTQIKLIWDFKGPDAEKTADHHCRHLAQYAQKFELSHATCGFNNEAELHWIAWLCVPEKDMIATRNALRPHRGLKITEA